MYNTALCHVEQLEFISINFLVNLSCFALLSFLSCAIAKSLDLPPERQHMPDKVQCMEYTSFLCGSLDCELSCMFFVIWW
jgi:hypothetical protein